jgi:hypothetical protein
MSARPMREPRFATMLVAAWLLVVLELMLKFWPETAVTLNQPDDAMRLVQVREFLGGHSWFDLHMARLQPPFGYDPHWSRLVDAGLAGTFILFHQLTNALFSERLMRAVWPVLWLLPVISGAAAIAWRIAKREAAIVVLLFAVGGLPAMQQFRPGRIDHHNVQIAIAVLTVAATVWADRSRWAATAAGILTGLGIGIGFEGVPFLAMCAAVFAVRFIQDKKAAGSVRAYGFSVAVSTIGAFIVNVSPDHWARTACDCIAINSATGVILGGFGLALITYSHDSRRSVRCGLIAAVAAAAALVFALSEPRCLGGPFAMLDPTVKQMWLRHVEEGQPMLSVLAEQTATGLWLSMFPLVAVVAVIVLGLRNDARQDFGFLVASATLLLAVALMVFMEAKFYNYAMWLAMPLLAMLAIRLFAVLRLESVVPCCIAGSLLTPVVLSASAMAVANASGLIRHNSSADLEPKGCFMSQSYAQLAKLPPGLVVTNVDYGPFVLALTPHSVLAAPYHRLSAGIISTNKIFSAPPDQAHRIITRLRANYVAMCGLLTPVGLTNQQLATSLWEQLHAGAVPDWLKREPAADGQPFVIYRVKP